MANESAPIQVTRVDLYRQVWSTPLVQLAARYRTTTNELASICARMNVPRPPSGYWMMKSNGKPVVQLEFPAAGPETVLEIAVAPTPPKSRLTPAQVEFETQLAKARAKFTGMNVPEDIGRPHPVIEHWLVEHDRKKREAARIHDPLHHDIVH